MDEVDNMFFMPHMENVCVGVQWEAYRSLQMFTASIFQALSYKPAFTIFFIVLSSVQGPRIFVADGHMTFILESRA